MNEEAELYESLVWHVLILEMFCSNDMSYQS